MQRLSEPLGWRRQKKQISISLIWYDGWSTEAGLPRIVTKSPVP